MARLRKSRPSCETSYPYNTRSTAGKTHQSKVVQPKALLRQPPAKKRRYRPGSKALKEIRHYQRCTGFLLPRLPFQRIIREIGGNLLSATPFRFTAEALECLQVATEALIIHLFEDSVLVMVNAKRKTLMEKDVQLIRRIRGI